MTVLSGAAALAPSASPIDEPRGVDDDPWLTVAEIADELRPVRQDQRKGSPQEGQHLHQGLHQGGDAVGAGRSVDVELAA